MEHEEIRAALEKSEFFKNLSEKDTARIAEICEPCTYDEGEYIFRQGDFGEHLYIIADGYVFLERTMDVGARKGSVVIAALGRGRVLGCWSTLLGESHIALSSAICQKPSHIISIKGSDLREMMVGRTDLGFKVLERLCFLLRDRIQATFGAMDKI